VVTTCGAFADNDVALLRATGGAALALSGADKDEVEDIADEAFIAEDALPLLAYVRPLRNGGGS